MSCFVLYDLEHFRGDWKCKKKKKSRRKIKEWGCAFFGTIWFHLTMATEHMNLEAKRLLL